MYTNRKTEKCQHGPIPTRSNAQQDVNMAYGLYVTTTYGRHTYQNIFSLRPVIDPLWATNAAIAGYRPHAAARRPVGADADDVHQLCPARDTSCPCRAGLGGRVQVRALCLRMPLRTIDRRPASPCIAVQPRALSRATGRRVCIPNIP